jgi:hypothetical protein
MITKFVSGLFFELEVPFPLLLYLPGSLASSISVWSLLWRRFFPVVKRAINNSNTLSLPP